MARSPDPGPSPAWEWSRRPVWPWLFVVLGLFLVAFFGSTALFSQGVSEKIERSTPGQLAPAIDRIGQYFGVSGVGQLVDPRNEQPYIDAQKTRYSSLAMAGAGFVMILFGLGMLAIWRPAQTPIASVAKKKKDMPLSVGLAWLGALLVVLGCMAILVVGAAWLATGTRLPVVGPLDIVKPLIKPDYQQYGFRVSANNIYGYRVKAKSGATIEGWFRDAKDNNITFSILDPNNRVVYNPGLVAGRHEFRVRAELAGEYILLFDTRHSTFSGRTMELHWRTY